MIEKNKKSLLLLAAVFLVLIGTTACLPLAPTVVPTTHLVPEETATHPPIVTTANTVTTVPTATLLPTQAPSPTPTLSPSLTQTPPAVIIADTFSEVGYNLPLTIQHVSETEATLFFELETPADGSMLYWPAAHPDQIAVVPFSPAETLHQVRLEGLLPGNQYQAVVGLSAEGDLYQPPNFRGMDWGSLNFNTPGGEEPLRIGVIGDSGLGESSTLALAEQMAAHDLDFVLHTGDVVYLMKDHPDPFDAYVEKYYQTLAPLLHTLPIYTVVGNHDIEPATLWEGQPFYYYAFPPFLTPTFPPSDFNGKNQWYIIAFGRIQFLMLDTQTLFGEDGLAEQTLWLKPGQIPVVFSGHEHFYERLEVDGITYVISGGGTSILYNKVEQHSHSQVYARQMHFMLVEIYTDRIEIKAITEAGELLDQFDIPLESPDS
jgi:predicted phosphodiesterase